MALSISFYFATFRADYPLIGDAKLLQHVQKLQVMQDHLISVDCIKPAIRCLDCGRSLVWFRDNISEEMFFKCMRCIRSPNLLRVCLKESAQALLWLFSAENIQLVSSALYLALNSSRYLNPLSPPSVPDDPVAMLCAFKEHSPNGFKFGGGDSSIVIADLYKIPKVPFAILIMSDTEMVPTRYYFHALNLHPTRKDKMTLFFNELTRVSNMVVKPESIMVLGPDLQNWINEETYAKEKHNLKMVVPFDELTELDSSKTLDVADVSQNFNEILRDALSICDSVCAVFQLDVFGTSNYSPTCLREKLQLYLASANWMRFFYHTPFKCYYYHCISDIIFDV